jgi:hypothetical protein
VAWERDHKVFYEIKVHVASLILSLVFKTVFGIFLSPLVCIKSVKCLEASNILEEKLSNKLKNSHDNFSGVRVSMVLGLLAWIS